MRGFIHAILDKVTNKYMFPVTVSDAIHHGNDTQADLNDYFLRPNKYLGKQFYEFSQVCHRGGLDYPENTMPAIEHAQSTGFDYVEIDVRVTSDGKFVALHDETINRTSTGTGNVSSYTYAQLQSYDFGSWKGVQFTGTKIPLISEIVMYCKAHRMMVELDCAGRLTESEMIGLYEEMRDLGCLNMIDICAYESEIQWLLDHELYDVGVSVSFFGVTPSVTAIENITPDISKMLGVNVSIGTSYITQSMVTTAHDRGFNIKTWTIASQADMNTYRLMGVDTILINSDSLFTIS